MHGLEELKEAMWAADGTGEFRFSDQDNPSQVGMFRDTFDDVWLADKLRTDLAGRTMTVSKVMEYVLTETPCHKFRMALKSLEVGKRRCITAIKAPKERKPGAYPNESLDKIVVTFEGSLFPG